MATIISCSICSVLLLSLLLFLYTWTLYSFVGPALAARHPNRLAVIGRHPRHRPTLPPSPSFIPVPYFPSNSGEIDPAEDVKELAKLGQLLERLAGVASTARNRPAYQNATSSHLFRTAIGEAYWLSAPLVNRFCTSLHPATAPASRRFTIATFGGSVSAGHDNPSYLLAYPEVLAADLRTVLSDAHFEHRNRAIGNMDTTQALACMPGRSGLGQSRVDVVVWEFAMNDAGARTADHHAWHQTVVRSGAVPVEVPFATSGRDVECTVRPENDTRRDVDALPASDVHDAQSVYAASTAAPFTLHPVFGSMGWFTCDMKRGIQSHNSVYCGNDALQMPRLHSSWHPNERGHRLIADQLMWYYGSAIAGAVVSLRRMISAVGTAGLPRLRVHGAVPDELLPKPVLDGCRTRLCRSPRIPQCYDMWKPSYNNLEALMDNSTGSTWHTRQSGGVGLEHRPPAMLYQKLCLGGNHSDGPLTLRLPREAADASLIAATTLNDCSKGPASTTPCGAPTFDAAPDKGSPYSILVDGKPAELVDIHGHNKTAKCMACTSRVGHAADCRDLFHREGGRWWGCDVVPLIVHEGPFADREAEHTITIQVSSAADDKEFCLRSLFWVFD